MLPEGVAFNNLHGTEVADESLRITVRLSDGRLGLIALSIEECESRVQVIPEHEAVRAVLQ